MSTLQPESSPSTPDKIKNLMRMLMDTQISDRRFRDMLFEENVLSDAVCAQVPPEAQAKQSFKWWHENRGISFMMKSLGHLTANPSDIEDREVLLNCFVFAKDAGGQEDGRRRSPNWDEQALTEFRNELVEGSRLEAKRQKLQASVPRLELILSGTRGTGKTCFINYFFTRFNDFLLNQHIIWVRVNVPDTFGGDTPNLRHWLLSKLTQVVLTYLHGKDEFAGIVDSLDQYVSGLRGNLRESCETNLELLKRQFIQKLDEKKLTESTVHEVLAEEMLRQVRNRNWTMVYILDGFDRVDLLPQNRKKFAHLLRELFSMRHRNSNLAGCFLVVTRNETLDFFGRNQLFNSHNDNIHRTSNWAVADTAFDTIIQTRIDYIQSRLSQMQQEGLENKLDLSSHVQSFVEHLLKVTESPDLKAMCNSFKDFHGRNHRGKTQLVQVLYHDFLRRGEQTRSYRLVEHICLAGYSYPPRFHSYSRDAKGNLVPLVAPRAFDALYVPNLFRFPYSPRGKSCPRAGTHLLAALRILQLLEAHQEYASSRADKNATVAVNEITSILAYLFGYSPEVIIRILEEMWQQGIVTAYAGAMLTSTMSDKTVKANPKAKVLYAKGDRKCLIYDIAYLNMCAMRMFVADSFLKLRIPLVRALSLDDSATVQEWVTWKLLNTATVVRLVHKANEVESHLPEGRTEYEKAIIALGHFQEVYETVPEMLTQITAALKPLEPTGSGLDRVDRTVNAYISSLVAFM